MCGQGPGEQQARGHVTASAGGSGSWCSARSCQFGLACAPSAGRTPAPARHPIAVHIEHSFMVAELANNLQRAHALCSHVGERHRRAATRGHRTIKSSPEGVLNTTPYNKTCIAEIWPKNATLSLRISCCVGGGTAGEVSAVPTRSGCGGVRWGPRASRGKGRFDCIPAMTDDVDGEIRRQRLPQLLASRIGSNPRCRRYAIRS